MEIQEVTSNVAITVKNEKLCKTAGKPGTQKTVSDKVTSEILIVLEMC